VQILHHSVHGEVHGAWMAKELARHGYQISPGSLYPTLHKMETEGLPLHNLLLQSAPGIRRLWRGLGWRPRWRASCLRVRTSQCRKR
jgi:hypothetical protein